MVKAEAGVLQLTAEMEMGLDSKRDWLDYVKRARCAKDNPRLPLFYRDAQARWWWMGLRAVAFVKGAERVCIMGRQRRANRQLLDVSKRGEVWAWVVDDSPALTPGSYAAPWPLETREDGKRYADAGLVATASLPHCARVLGWSGSDALPTVATFRDMVLAAWTGGDVERHRAKIPHVTFPDKAEHVKRRMEWGELVALIVKQGEAIEDLKESAAKIQRESVHTARRLDSVERHAAETRRRHAAEVETLRAEVETLRGLMI